MYVLFNILHRAAHTVTRVERKVQGANTVTYEVITILPCKLKGEWGREGWEEREKREGREE